MDTIKSTFNQASESLKGTSSEAQAEKDKKVAQGDTNAGFTTRAKGAEGYVENKLDQKSHEGKADVHEAERKST